MGGSPGLAARSVGRMAACIGRMVIRVDHVQRDPHQRRLDQRVVGEGNVEVDRCVAALVAILREHVETFAEWFEPEEFRANVILMS